MIKQVQGDGDADQQAAGRHEDQAAGDHQGAGHPRALSAAQGRGLQGIGLTLGGLPGRRPDLGQGQCQQGRQARQPLARRFQFQI